MNSNPHIGIVGAGKIGTAIARAALDAGYDVAISGSGAVDRIALTVDVLAPGARATTTKDVLEHGDIVILAVPTHRFRQLDPSLFDGKVVIDVMNYWEPIDGVDAELADARDGSSAVVQAHFSGAKVVKTLNQLGYHEFEEYRSAPEPTTAIGVASDHPTAAAAAARLVEALGFRPVDVGSLAAGRALGPDGAAFGVALSAAELRDVLALEHSR